MLHDPDNEALFPTLAPEVVEEMRAAGTEEPLEPGQAIFTEGEENYDFFVVLEGRIRVTKRMGGEERVLAVHDPGEFAGEIGVLTRAPALATGRAIGPARVLRIPAAVFRRMVGESTPLAEVALAAMIGRTADVNTQLRQQEKLVALGRMAAGLAHELNNPAAALRRAAAQLRPIIEQMQTHALGLHEQAFSPEQQALLAGLQHEVAACCSEDALLDPLARSDREDEVSAWLESHQVPDAWKVAPTLVAGGVKPEQLNRVAEQMGEGLACTVQWLDASVSASSLLREVEDAAGRISHLVGAIKEYSYMDQAPSQQPVELNRGLENTLTMLHHKLKHGVRVIREMDPDLPPIAAYGSELNQVWTNLIDNAVAAMNGEGELRIRTARDGDRVEVEIADNGPGIPSELQDRVWEPFFTTKDVGEGTGLGLDIARRIVGRRHNGTILLRSRPGETSFVVKLPIEGPPK